MCGDQILLTARIDQDALSDVAFEAFGCSASLAVASILTERLAGRPSRGRPPSPPIRCWRGRAG